MENIIEPTIDYDFSKLYLGPPSSIQGGAYFTRIIHGNNKQLFIQTPKSLSKQGFVKSGKKIYIDLMFESNDTIFVNWIENLEARCQELLFSKSDQWFQTALEKSDIESAFTSTLKIFKSGKYYLLRVNVKPNVKIYNESDEIVLMDDVNSEKHMISILEIQGIKFTSRNFQIEIELKQSMVVSPDPFLDTCFIRKPVQVQKNINTKIIDDTFNNNNDNDNDNNDNNDSNDDNNDTVVKNLLKDFIQESVNDLKDHVEEKDKENIKVEIEPVDIEGKIELEENKGASVSNEEDENVPLDFEDLIVNEKEEVNEVKEFDPSVNLEKDAESITLKNPNQVYKEIYQKAREKAKEAKKMAIQAYLELKNIKKTYMLDDIEDDSDDEDDFSENSSSSSEEDEENYE